MQGRVTEPPPEAENKLADLPPLPSLASRTYPVIGNRPFCAPNPGGCPSSEPLWAGTCKFGGDGDLDALNSSIQAACDSYCACDEWSWNCPLGSSWQPQAGYHAACTTSSYAASFKKSWMGNFSSFLSDVPLNRIPMAGSHDSATYSIPKATATIPASFLSAPVTIIALFFPPPFNIIAVAALSSIQVPVLYNATISPDQEALKPVENALKYVNLSATQATPALYGTTSVWARAQDVDILQQLNDGVRYLDLRVGAPGGANDLSQVRITHGLFGTTLNDVLGQVQKFYAQGNTSGEITILDFQDMNNLKNSDPQSGDFAISVADREKIQQQIVDKLWSLFGAKLAVPSNTITPAATYRDFRSAGYNVIVLYPSSAISSFNLNDYAKSKGYAQFLWNRGNAITNPYESSNDTLEKLLPWLKDHYSTLKTPTKFTVMQGINATTGAQIVRGFVPAVNNIDFPSSLEQASYAYTSVFSDIVYNNPSLLPAPGNGNYNIVIGDWYHLYPFTDNLIAAAHKLGVGKPYNPYHSPCIDDNVPHLGCMPSGFDFADACNWKSSGSSVVYRHASPAQDSWSCSSGGGFSPPKDLKAYCRHKGFGTSRPTDSSHNFDAFGWYCCYNDTDHPDSCQPVKRNPAQCDATVKQYCSCMYGNGNTCRDTSAVTATCSYDCSKVKDDWVARGHPAPSGNPFQDRTQCETFKKELSTSCDDVYACLWGQYACEPEFIQLSGTIKLLTQANNDWFSLACTFPSGDTPAAAVLAATENATDFTVTQVKNGYNIACDQGYITTQTISNWKGKPTLALSFDQSKAAVFQPIAAPDGTSMWLTEKSSGKLLTGDSESLLTDFNEYLTKPSASQIQLWRLPDSSGN